MVSFVFVPIRCISEIAVHLFNDVQLIFVGRVSTSESIASLFYVHSLQQHE